MLRIKKEIDLKELEKFGFIKYKSIIVENRESKYSATLWVNIESKEISADYPVYYNFEDEESYLNTLYDLIKADLVEKVED